MDINSLFECFEESSTTSVSTNLPSFVQNGDYAGVCDQPTTSAKKRSYEDEDNEIRSKKSKEHGDYMSCSDFNGLSKGPTVSTDKYSCEDNDSENMSNKLKEEEDVSESYSDLNLEKYIPQITIRKLETGDGCTHEVALPPDHDYIPLTASSAEPAKKYSFELDPFQKEAILCVENRQSVLVSAHTSAGKTVVAEYAIALSLKNNQRVVYTTPIKALSNQKFREFTEEFKDVGLITGDVTINPEASCLVMTTEVLRNMLYRGSEVMREVGWVIFDEIHYMRDKERGVVWEETLILLPDKVNYVFLSATIPNARQFAEWICHLHSQPCHVIYTEYRPTPLEHYLFPPDGDGYLIVDGTGQFHEDNFNNAMTALSDSAEGASREGEEGERRGRRRKKNAGTDRSGYVYSVIREIRLRDLMPVIVFSFSKKDCEAYAMEVAKLDFTRMEEKKLIDEIVTNALEALSEDDRKLPQVQNMIPLLRRGIGVHHGGLLPILKEIIEILFGNGFIGALFATETFAMGLNMPARSVLFTSCRKFDGKDYRCISSGEYIQMSGRAGRRGLDDTGTVMMIMDHTVTSTALKNIMVGKADPLNSAFRLTYNMILNLIRVEGINPEYMLERSFYQFQNRSALPGLLDKVKAKQEKYDSMVIDNEELIASYCSVTSQLEQLKAQVKAVVMSREHLDKLVRRGRLVKVKTDKYDYGWCIVARQHKHKEGDPPHDDNVLLVDIFIYVRCGFKVKLNEIGLLPCPNNERGTVNKITIPHTFIEEISPVVVKYPTKIDIPLVVESYENMKKKFPDGLPLVDPINDLKLDNPTLRECVENIERLQERLKDHPLNKNKDERDKLMPQYKKKEEYKEELRLAMAELDRAKHILQMDELKKRKRVLRTLGYCTSSDVIQLKGRIACELGSADELLLTELIFNGVLNPLTPEQSAALVSCFVCDSGARDVAVADELGAVLRQLQEYARRIAKVTMEAKMDLDEEEYVGKFKSTLMDVVHAWAKGVSFLQVSAMTDVFEGSIVRCIRRLEEVLRQLCQAARSIGNTDLEQKFSGAIRLLKRDIVFAASLYM